MNPHELKSTILNHVIPKGVFISCLMFGIAGIRVSFGHPFLSGALPKLPAIACCGQVAGSEQPSLDSSFRDLPDQGSEQGATTEVTGSVTSAPILTPKILRLARYGLGRRDKDGNGAISPSEWPEVKDQWNAIDSNHDGSISFDEYAAWLARFAASRRIRLRIPLTAVLPPGEKGTGRQPEAFGRGTPGSGDELSRLSGPAGTAFVPPIGTAASPGSSRPAARTPQQPKYYVPPESLPANLPNWFRTLDRDGDGQLTVAEFVAEGGPERLAEFDRYDRDGDGVLTPMEAIAGPKARTPSQESGPSPPDNAPTANE
jgi:hypothetical protein